MSKNKCLFQSCKISSKVNQGTIFILSALKTIQRTQNFVLLLIWRDILNSHKTLGHLINFLLATQNLIKLWAMILYRHGAKLLLELSGIDIKKYCTHSTKSATSSKPKSMGTSLKIIIEYAEWKSEKTFAHYYDKKIEEGLDIRLQ